MAQEAEAIQCLTDFGLKNYDYKYYQDGAKLLKHPAGHVQIQKAGGKIDESHNAKPQ